MAEFVISLILEGAIERGKCYLVTGTMANRGSGESALFQIGNDTSKEVLGTVVADGNFSLPFDYTTSSTFFKTLYITERTGADADVDFEITNLALKLDPDCAEEYCSECFSLDNCGVAPTKEYLYLEWTNSDDGFGMNYTSVPLKHSLWIKGGLRNFDYPYATEEYFSTSAGYNFPVFVDSVKTAELWVEDVPEYIHDALRLGVVHDSFTVNGVEYSKEPGSYSPDWDTPNSLLAPVIVKLREKSQDTRNENC